MVWTVIQTLVDAKGYDHRVRTPPAELTAALLDVGEQVLSSPDVRLEDVARLVGTSRARMYYYFAGAPDLRAFLVREHTREGAEVVARAAAGAEGTAADRLHAVVAALVALLRSRPGLCAGLLGAAGGTDVVAMHDEGVGTPLRALIAAGVEDGSLDVGDPAVAADAVAGAVLMSVIGESRRHGAATDDGFAHAVATQVVDGVRTLGGSAPAGG